MSSMVNEGLSHQVLIWKVNDKAAFLHMWKIHKKGTKQRKFRIKISKLECDHLFFGDCSKFCFGP
jgi:hypothetical protein